MCPLDPSRKGELPQNRRLYVGAAPGEGCDGTQYCAITTLSLIALYRRFAHVTNMKLTAQTEAARKDRGLLPPDRHRSLEGLPPVIAALTEIRRELPRAAVIAALELGNDNPPFTSLQPRSAPDNERPSSFPSCKG